jgi:hypothetical protein
MPTYVTFVDLKKNKTGFINALHKIPNSFLRHLLRLRLIGLQTTFHENTKRFRRDSQIQISIAQ